MFAISCAMAPDLQPRGVQVSNKGLQLWCVASSMARHTPLQLPLVAAGFFSAVAFSFPSAAPQPLFATLETHRNGLVIFSLDVRLGVQAGHPRQQPRGARVRLGSRLAGTAPL